VAKGDLDAAVRARRAALGQDSTSVSDWTRLGDLLELAGDTVSAEAARAHATSRP
jgi:predicted TPR repeat methyltransferase